LSIGCTLKNLNNGWKILWFSYDGSFQLQDQYTLLKHPYGDKALAPYISEEQLTLHHQKYHQAYVTGANALLE